MSESPKRLSERLQTEGEKTAAFFQNLTQEQWETQVYPTGPGWSVRQILVHFLSSELAFGRVIDSVLVGGEGAPENFDLESFNESDVANRDTRATANLINQYLAARAENTRRVFEMQPESLLRIGRHPTLGFTALQDIIKLLYLHNQLHLRDVRRSITPTDM